MPAPEQRAQAPSQEKVVTRDIHATLMEQEEVSQSLPCPSSGHSRNRILCAPLRGGKEGGKGTGADAAQDPCPTFSLADR